MNFPDHRGTATAFPLAAFGLSAAFFAIISTYAFPNNTDKFLLLLATGCFLLAFCPLFFLSIMQPTRSSSLPTRESTGNVGSQVLHRRKSSDSKHHASPEEPGTCFYVRVVPTSKSESCEDRAIGSPSPSSPSQASDETSSLLSKSSSIKTRDPALNSKSHESDANRTRQLDIRGLALLPRPEFWQLFLLMGLLTGIGLMTIKYANPNTLPFPSSLLT